jgi:signal transduction histidine kinase/predicted negative regulator of RcsB-dependent stress response
MLRSPFFYFIFLLFLFSCKEKPTIITNEKIIKKEAGSFRNKGIATYQQTNFDSSFFYFNKSKTLYEKTKDSANIVYVLSQMANIQQINGDYYGSRETLTEALPYVKKRDIYTATINNFFGIADKELSNYDDAIYYYNEALKDCDDAICKESILNNISAVYIKQQEYDEAIKILEAITKTSEAKYENNKLRMIDNLGYAYFKKGLNEKGFLLMQKSADLRKTFIDDYGSIENNLHLSEYYSESNLQKAKQFALNAYQTATKMHSVDERLEALSLLMINNSLSNNTVYIQKFIHLNDSILKVRNNFKNKFAKIKYDSKKEKDENEQLRLEKAENLVALKDAENETIVAVAGFIILLFLGAYLKKHLDNRNRIGKIKTAYDTETRIAKDIHDGLANDVFHAITYTQTQPLTNDYNKENLLQKLDHIYGRVRGISRENNDIDTGPNYANNLKEMLSTYNSNDTNVIINNIEKVNWDLIEDLKKISIQRVLHELMVNMKKHSNAPIVVVKFESKLNTLLIDYSDNGKGCEKTKIIKNGLQNMENRILAVKGTITFDTEPDKGFKVKISMPK